MRSVKVYEETWPLHTPFVIARGSRSEAHVVVVELEEEGVKGIGECTPYPRYGESDASVMAQIMSIMPQLENGLTREALQKLLPAGAARNAVDSALWDLQARQRCRAARRDAVPGFYYRANGSDRHAGTDGCQCGGTMGKRGDVAEN